jgi:hypothetical protein
VELPTAPIALPSLSILRIRIARPRAALVNVMQMNRKSYRDRGVTLRVAERQNALAHQWHINVSQDKGTKSLSSPTDTCALPTSR